MSFVRRLEVARTWIAASGTEDKDIISVSLSSTLLNNIGKEGATLVSIHLKEERFDALLANGSITDHVESVAASGKSVHRYARTKVSDTEFVEATCCRSLD